MARSDISCLIGYILFMLQVPLNNTKPNQPIKTAKGIVKKLRDGKSDLWIVTGTATSTCWQEKRSRLSVTGCRRSECRTLSATLAVISLMP